MPLSSRVLASYHSARSLYDYIQLAMPYNEPGSLGPEAYWDIVAYLIDEHDLGRLDRPVMSTGADSLLLAEPRGG